MTGPLAGVRVLELAGQGPGPFACMLLGDLGAEVVTVERVGVRRHPADAHGRGRRSVCVDLKDPRGAEALLGLVARADVLVEGFRPGVAERLGLGPVTCLERNPRLVYGRMTGWGQDGPLAQAAGHDIDYLALSGGLHLIGSAGGPPVPPLNLVGDYGAGGTFLALGVVAAVLEARRSGLGQVVDAAMVDGLAALLAPFHAWHARGGWADERGANLLDGGAPHYAVYETADGRHLAVGALEPPFRRALVDVLGLDVPIDAFDDQARWPELRRRLASVIGGRTREDWVRAFEGRDACVAPVLDLLEAREHPHARERAAFTEVDGVPHPAPAPRFSRTALSAPTPAEEPGASTDELLAEVGYDAGALQALRRDGVVA